MRQSCEDGKHYYDWEAEKRGDGPWKRPDRYPTSGAHWYNQAHAPILQQQSIEGHSSGGQQLSKTGEWQATLSRLWNNMVDQKMYITGGIGAMKQWEGFGIDYVLPQSTDEGGCYAETCASIAVMFLADRMLDIDHNGRYADIMELCLYNNVMTAMSLDSKSFTYVNQLSSSEADKSGRKDWFCFTLTLSASSASVSNGYLTLDATYLSANLTFTLDIHGFSPRFTEPHPYTNQNTISIARGPIIYCLEDAQNPWETNHFKDVVLKPCEKVTEEERVHEPSGEKYVALRAKVTKRSLARWQAKEVGQDPSVTGSWQQKQTYTAWLTVLSPAYAFLMA
ncbi:DUF1680-domain-containing protein [Setomelanomma holmii]|uniref:DUF1680-domain-containing protein n=1 Tax=Setomelanomma holmii TaxID=210430 RepID=A0A9P4GXM6_9PLEO|nr:DUF1680-domain-containing protein [Setomelanomma holmii]